MEVRLACRTRRARSAWIDPGPVRRRRLQTDHIDLYWVHNRDVLTGVEELMRALDDQVRLGKIL